MKKIKIAGLRHILDLSQVEFSPRLTQSRSPAMILARLAENGINVEFIIAHRRTDETMELVLGVKRNQIAATLGLLRGIKEELGLEKVYSRDRVGMISLFPHGSRAAVIGNFLSAFRDAGVKLLAISFSLSAISGLLEESRIPDALNALSEYFELPG